MVFEPQQKGGITPVPPQGEFCKVAQASPLGVPTIKNIPQRGIFYFNLRTLPFLYSFASLEKIKKSVHLPFGSFAYSLNRPSK